MRITVKLFASFRSGRFQSQVWERPDGITVAELAEELGIRVDELGVVAVNARHVRPDHALSDGDACSLFPLIGGG